MFIEQHEKQEINRFRGIEYYTVPNLYQANYTSGKGTWVIGFYPSLELAIAARKEFIEKRCIRDREASLSTRNSDTPQQHREEKEVAA